MSSPNSSKISLYGGIATNIAIALSKFVAAYLTGSSAMLSEGIHSLAFGRTYLPSKSRPPWAASKKPFAPSTPSSSAFSWKPSHSRLSSG